LLTQLVEAVIDIGVSKYYYIFIDVLWCVEIAAAGLV